MYVWRNKHRRDKRHHKTDGPLTWGPPKHSENRTLEDETLRQENERLFVAAFVKRIRKIIQNYLSTPNGAVEINHVINEIDKINNTGSRRGKVPPEMKKRKNVYEIFRKFDTDGSDSIDLDELSVLLKHLGVNLKEEELNALMQDLNTGGSGEISFDEFYAWFEKEGEKQQKKTKWNVNVFKKKDPNEDIYRNFKRMVLEVEARNLIVDKVLHDTERDALKEFRIAHPPLMGCPHCDECFLRPNDYHPHVADTSLHEVKQKEKDEISKRFIAVENAFLGAYGRKLTAHRLLYSVDLNGMESRLNVVTHQPYRPMIADPEGRRAEQLRNKALVFGADPRAGVRPLHTQHHLDKQHRTTWTVEHGGMNLPDTLTSVMQVRDLPIDVVIAPTCGGHADVRLEWREVILSDVYILGEFNNWKATMMYPDSMGVYSYNVKLPPGRYQYRFIADGVERHNEAASSVEVDGVTNNTVLVISPLEGESKKLPTEIYLRNSFLYDDGAWALTRCIHRNSHIELMDLSNNNISDEGMMAVAEACKSLLALKTLKLNSNGFSFDGCRYLSTTYKSSDNLHTLELCANRIADDGAEEISKILNHHRSLKILRLDGNYIGDDGVTALGKCMQNNNTLEVLSLSNNKFRFPGAERLCFFLRMNGSLTELNLAGNPLGPEGIGHVGELLMYAENLKTLDISHTQMMLAKRTLGLMSICQALRRNKGVKTLIMRGNNLNNDAALDIAYGMSGNRTITTLDLENNPIVSQWFQPNVYLKTKLMSKMPTIRTSLDRNRRIEEDPVLHARWSVQPKQYDENPNGQWTKRRKWKISKKKEDGGPAVDTSVEQMRKTMEDDFVADELFKYAVTLNAFLDSKEGTVLVKCLAKLVVHYCRSLCHDVDRQPEWIKSAHLAMISALLLDAKKEYETAAVPPPDDKLAPILVDKTNPEVQLTTVEPPSSEYELHQLVPSKCVLIFFRKLAMTVDEKNVNEVISMCRVTGEDDQISIRKFYKCIIKNHFIYSLKGVGPAISRMLMKPPLPLARKMICDNSIYKKRNELKMEYRKQTGKEPLFVCHYCGKRFTSEKSERRHAERAKKEHIKSNNAEELWLSEAHIIRRAKYLQSGMHFPTYYELGDTILLPRYYCPQIFDNLGDEGRPIGVIEPNLTYRVEDILGNWILVRYSGGLGWTQFRLGSIPIMHPSMNHVKGFWDDLHNYPKPVFYMVSDFLPDGVEIKVRQRPVKEAIVCGTLEKGMVVICEAKKGNWLQIRYHDYDTVWVLETSGEIALLEPLHRFLQVKMQSITKNTSPCMVPPHLLELTPEELREDLLIKRREKAVRAAADAAVHGETGELHVPAGTMSIASGSDALANTSQTTMNESNELVLESTSL